MLGVIGKGIVGVFAIIGFVVTVGLAMFYYWFSCSPAPKKAQTGSESGMHAGPSFGAHARSESGMHARPTDYRKFAEPCEPPPQYRNAETTKGTTTDGTKYRVEEPV